MASLVAEHPGVRAVFNLTPALLLQIEDLAAGASDRYWVATEIPPGGSPRTTSVSCWSASWTSIPG